MKRNYTLLIVLAAVAVFYFWRYRRAPEIAPSTISVTNAMGDLNKGIQTPKPAHQIKTAELANIIEAYLKVEKVVVTPKSSKKDAPKKEVEKVEEKVVEPEVVLLEEKGDKHNCTVVILKNAFDLEYEVAAQYAIDLWKRKRCHGVKNADIITTFETGEVLGRKVEKVEATNDYLAIGGGVITRKMNLTSFSRKFKTGTFVILVNYHAVVCKNGEMLNAVQNEYGIKNALILNAWEVK